MDLEFDRGSSSEPKGHAIIYFRVRYEADKLLATYVVTLPLVVDFAKYVPPFLASHLAAEPLKELSAFSLPPVPEEAESHDQLVRLAELRSDDLVCAGTVATNDLPEMMQAASDAVQAYSRLWSEYVTSLKPAPVEETDSYLDVNEVLYSLMNERDRLQELVKLVGKLRFAVEGEDRVVGSEVHQQIDLVARHLPPTYQVANLLQAAENTAPKGGMLAQLYLDRCYKLMEGDDHSVTELDERIRALEASN